MFLLGIVGGIILLVRWYLKFELIYTIKEITSKGILISKDKGREIKTKEGEHFIRLLKNKENLPIPPTQCVELTKKGKKHITIYKVEGGSFVYAQDKTTLKDLEEKGAYKTEIEKNKKNFLEALKEKITKKKTTIAQYVYLEDKPKIIKAMDAFPTSQRAMAVRQCFQAQREKGFSWKQNIPMIAGLGILLVGLILFFAYYEDIAAPHIRTRELDVEIREKDAEITQMLHEIILERQMVAEQSKPPD